MPRLIFAESLSSSARQPTLFELSIDRVGIERLMWLRVDIEGLLRNHPSVLHIEFDFARLCPARETQVTVTFRDVDGLRASASRWWLNAADAPYGSGSLGFVRLRAEEHGVRIICLIGGRRIESPLLSWDVLFKLFRGEPVLPAFPPPEATHDKS